MLRWLRQLPFFRHFSATLHRRIGRAHWGVNFTYDIARILKTSQFSQGESIRTIFDVGANVGQTTLSCLREFPEAEIYCFEPVESTFSKLCTSVKTYNRVHPFKTAFGDKKTTKSMFQYESSVLASFVNESPIMSSKNAVMTIPMEVETIDHFCADQNIKRIDILKVDTEGFDFEVLQGARTMLSSGKIRFVYFEFFMTQKMFCGESTSARYDEIIAFLTGLSFRTIAFYTDFVNPSVSASHHNALMMYARQN